jgi:ribokinase
MRPVDEPGRVDVVVVGTVNLDHVVRVAHLPARGETVVGDDLVIAPGGKGANQALAAARLGARTVLVGCVGDDPEGAALLDYLATQPQLDLADVSIVPGPSGAAWIAVDGAGGNTIVSVRAANGHLGEEMVHRAGSRIGAARVLLAQLGVPVDGVRAALEIARSVGTITVVDPSPADEMTDELLRLVDILTPNESEATQLTGVDVHDEGSAARAADALLRRGCASVVVTMAERGAVYCEPGAAPYSVAAFPVDALDPTGAGDAFAGALAVSLAGGETMSNALVTAAAAGALATTRPGAAPALPTHTDLTKFLASPGQT